MSVGSTTLLHTKNLIPQKLSVFVADKITKDLAISEIFDSFPDKAELLADALMNKGLHCVGCYANAFESLEEGFVGHGFTKKELNDSLKELNSIVNDTSVKAFTISSEASKFIVSVSNKRKSGGKTYKFFRLVVSSDCSKDSCDCVTYSFKFTDDKPKVNDLLFPVSYDSRVSLVVNESDNSLIKGCTLNYSPDEGFVIG